MVPRTGIGVAVFVAGCLLPIVAPGQAVRRIPDAVDCPRCRIVAAKLGTISHEIESADRVTNGDAAMDRRGHIYLVSDWRRWQLDVFDSTGRFLSTVGRRGKGPGEFTRIRGIVIDAADSARIIDVSNARLSVVSPSTLGAVRATPWAGQLLFNPQPNRDGELVGVSAIDLLPGKHVIRVVNDSGRVIREMDAGRDSTRMQPWSLVGRTITPDGSGGVYAARLSTYEIDRWGQDGRRTHSFERRVPWFPPFDDPNARPTPAQGSVPQVREIRMDSAGLLWIMIHVRDARWRSALTEVRDEAGRMVRIVGDRNRYDDTIIELFDPKSGRIVTTRRFDESFIRFLRPGYVMSAGDDPEPHVVIWRLSLERPR